MTCAPGPCRPALPKLARVSGEPVARVSRVDPDHDDRGSFVLQQQPARPEPPSGRPCCAMFAAQGRRPLRTAQLSPTTRVQPELYCGAIQSLLRFPGSTPDSP